MKALTRTMMVTPGYDCLHAPCEHEPKGDHGISGGEWIYVVSDGERALSLGVLTQRYPETVPEATRLRARHRDTLANLDLHAKEPWADYQREYGPRKNCRWLDGADCYSDGSSLQGSEFFDAHGDKTGPNQPEEFWLALEAEFRARSDSRPALPGWIKDAPEGEGVIDPGAEQAR